MSKLGKFVIDLGYVVELDNPKMVEKARGFFYEDLMNIIKHDELEGAICLVESPKSKKSDIPDHIKDE